MTNAPVTYTPETWFSQFEGREPGRADNARIKTFTRSLPNWKKEAERLANLLASSAPSTPSDVLRLLFIQQVFNRNITGKCHDSPTGTVLGNSLGSFYLLAGHQKNNILRLFAFRFEDLIDKGSWKRVYKALSLDTGRLEAVSVIDCKKPYWEKAALREVEMQKRVQEVFFSVLHEGTLYSALPIANAGTLHDPFVRIYTRGARNFLHLACIRALKKVHAEKIVVADIKRSNFLLHWNEWGELIARINDFNLSFFLDQKGHTLSTKEFASPEQHPSSTYLKSRRVSQASDIFQLGLALWLFNFHQYPPPYKEGDFKDYPLRWKQWEKSAEKKPFVRFFCRLMDPYPSRRPDAEEAEKQFTPFAINS